MKKYLIKLIILLTFIAIYALLGTVTTIKDAIITFAILVLFDITINMVTKKLASKKENI